MFNENQNSFEPALVEYSVPFNANLEFDLLNALFQFEEGQEYILSNFIADYFYLEYSREVFKICLEMKKQSNIMLTKSMVYNQVLLKNDTDLLEFFKHIVFSGDRSTQSFDYIKKAIKLLKDHYIRRRSQELHVKSLQEITTSNEPTTLLKKVQSEFMELDFKNEDEEEESLESVLTDIQKRVDDIYSDNLTIPEVSFSTGLKEVDEIILGYQPGKLYIVAARPAMGKTSFVLNSVFGCVEKDEPFLLNSLEMGLKEMALKLVASKTGFSTYAFKTGFIATDQKNRHLDIQTKIEYIKEKPLVIKDKNCYTIEDIRSSLVSMVKKYGKVSGLAVDYLQLMEGDSKEGREKEISKIARGLKKIAKEFNIPVIALSQLSRTVEQRQNKRPILSDLRESGSIEQDADVVMFIYRDEYYNPETDKKDEAEIIIAKHREGAIGTATVKFNKTTITFEDKGI